MRCNTCGGRFDRLRKVVFYEAAEPALVPPEYVCPHCGSDDYEDDGIIGYDRQWPIDEEDIW